MDTKKTRMIKPRIKYFETGPWPIYLGFTRDETSFLSEMRRLNIPNPPDFVTKNADATTHILSGSGNITLTTIIICVKPSKKHSKEQHTALVAHEAVHVWWGVCEAMGGDSHPGGEHEAYGVQWITQVILEELWKKR